MAPGDRARGMTTGRSEEIKQGDLVVKGLLERPAVQAVRRAGKRIALLQERPTGQCITGIWRRVEEWLIWKDITVTVKNQSAIPVRRNGDGVVGST